MTGVQTCALPIFYGYRPNDIPVGEPGRWLELIPYGKNSIFLANAAAIRNVYNPAVDTTVIDGTTGFINVDDWSVE